MAAIDETISLRPGAGVKNPFASFAMGAGLGLKNKTAMAISNNEKKKHRGEVIKYPRDFLMKFAEMYSRLPTELQFSNLEIVLDPSDPEREAQRQLLQRVAADDADERDWRARTPLPPGDAQAREPAPTDPNAPKIQRATDLGRTAWAAGNAAPEGTVQSLRKVKGILNKLTPEKFERLLGQLIPLISSYEVLQGTISQVFENAVAQPTFVNMYADLCSELDASLPEFPNALGEPQSFKKLLANTCQEEYETTEQMRGQAAELAGDEREDAHRKAKQRLLGNIRLIAELFKKQMVNDRIMLLILGELLGPQNSEPSDDSIEAACELISTAAAALETTPKSKARLDATFQRLSKLATSKHYSPRVRFVIKDVIDLRSQHWVARRETFTAKKLEEIRSEAQAELGIVDVDIPGLAPLASGLDPLVGKNKDDVELFPAFKGSSSQTQSSSQNGGGDDGGKFTTLLGDFQPMPDASRSTVDSAPEIIDGQPKTGERAAAVPRKAPIIASEEDRLSLAKSIYTDYISSRDMEEAFSAATEIVIPGFGPKIVTVGLEKAFDALDEKEQNSIVDVVIALVSGGILTKEDVETAVGVYAEQLEDIALDIPAAPRIMGRLLGLAAEKNLMSFGVVGELAQPVESAEPRRAFVVSALAAVKEVGGEDKMVSVVRSAGVNVGKLFEHDAEFEEHLIDAAAYAKEQGLTMLL